MDLILGWSNKRIWGLGVLGFRVLISGCRDDVRLFVVRKGGAGTRSDDRSGSDARDCGMGTGSTEYRFL